MFFHVAPGLLKPNHNYSHFILRNHTMAWPSTQTFWVAPKRDMSEAFSVIGIMVWQVSCRTAKPVLFLNTYSQTSGFFFFKEKTFLYSLFISCCGCWGNALRSWRLDSIWDAGAFVKMLVSGGCLGAWLKAGSAQEFIFRNCSPMAPVCLFATFHPVLQM